MHKHLCLCVGEGGGCLCVFLWWRRGWLLNRISDVNEGYCSGIRNIIFLDISSTQEMWISRLRETAPLNSLDL